MDDGVVILSFSAGSKTVPSARENAAYLFHFHELKVLENRNKWKSVQTSDLKGNMKNLTAASLLPNYSLYLQQMIPKDR